MYIEEEKEKPFSYKEEVKKAFIAISVMAICLALYIIN
jgi:hypothetical protein